MSRTPAAAPAMPPASQPVDELVRAALLGIIKPEVFAPLVLEELQRFSERWQLEMRDHPDRPGIVEKAVGIGTLVDGVLRAANLVAATADLRACAHPARHDGGGSGSSSLMVSTTDAARQLGLSGGHVARMARAGKIPGAVPDGDRWKIPLAWVVEQKEQPK